MAEPLYEIYAVRYAHHDRRASENFIGGVTLRIDGGITLAGP